MTSLLRALSGAVLALGLLGSAALSTHAAPAHGIRHLNYPTLQMTAAYCGVNISGHNFTPGGRVDLYTYGSDGVDRGISLTAFSLTWFGVQAGDISQSVDDYNNPATIKAIAYDESTHQWSNWSTATEYCQPIQ